jgi:hypothetical protein
MPKMRIGSIFTTTNFYSKPNRGIKGNAGTPSIPGPKGGMIAQRPEGLKKNFLEVMTTLAFRASFWSC